MTKNIYFDYAATTPVDPRVVKAMMPFFSNHFGNPNSLHSYGQKAALALSKARKEVSRLLNCQPEEIIFTASATESNNLALKGIMARGKRNKILVSTIEHDCVLNSVRWLKKDSWQVETIPVDKYGLVDLKELSRKVDKKTLLVSIMHANNEIGTIQPIAEIGHLVKRAGAFFHVDASQTLGKIKINLKQQKIDLLTASAHKIYGPKGVALLYLKTGVELKPLIHGGGQERGLRSGTVNVAGIVGFAKAFQLAEKQLVKESSRLVKLRNRIIDFCLKNIPFCYLNGHPNKRLANNINLRFDFIEGEALVLRLSDKGIAVSTGSACSSPKLAPSHVLLATGLSPDQSHGSLRITLGRQTTSLDVDYLLTVLPKVVSDLREISPFKGEL